MGLKNAKAIELMTLLRTVISLFLIVCCLPNYGQQTGKFTDPRDKKVYKTVKIGTQIWMAQNLAYKVDTGCWSYDNYEKNIPAYGYLYNWETAKNVCPIGWHLPSNDEWITLIDFTGGKDSAGNILREADTKHWSRSGHEITNKSGFTALPGGCRNLDGSYYGLWMYGNWWTSTPNQNTGAYDIYMSCSNGLIGSDFSMKKYGFSVRCVKNK
jgi:uncharacterized protein (TIGR02145 family)